MIITLTIKKKQMKKILLISLILLFSIPSFGQQKQIKKIVIQEDGYDYHVAHKPTRDVVSHNGLVVKITLVSGEELNTLFLSERNLSGLFDYSMNNRSKETYLLSKKRISRKKSKSKSLLDGILWLIENNKISQEEGRELIKQITSTDTTLGGDITQFSYYPPSPNNPFYIDNRYLSVFRVQISNDSDSEIIFNNQIKIETGNSLLDPFSSEYLMELLTQTNGLNQGKALILNKYNLPRTLSIPPQAKIEKLIAVSPIDYREKQLKISFSGNPQKFEWQISQEKTTREESFTFHEFDVFWHYGKVYSTFGNELNLIKGKNDIIFIASDKLFIDEEYLDEEFEIFTLSKYQKKLYYGRNMITASYFLEKDRSMRKSIKLRLERMPKLDD